MMLCSGKIHEAMKERLSERISLMYTRKSNGPGAMHGLYNSEAINFSTDKALLHACHHDRGS